MVLLLFLPINCDVEEFACLYCICEKENALTSRYMDFSTQEKLLQKYSSKESKFSHLQHFLYMDRNQNAGESTVELLLQKQEAKKTSRFNR